MVVMSNAEWSRYFHYAKLRRQLVRVVDCYGQVREGRIYRNSYDRVNVVPLNGENTNSHAEVYYHTIKRVDIIGTEPDGLQPFFGDWDYYERDDNEQ